MTNSILLVSFFAPCRGHAGGQRLLDLYMQIRRIRPEIRLGLVTCTHPDADWGLENLNSIFNDIYWISCDAFSSQGVGFPLKVVESYDLIDCQYHRSGALIQLIRKNFPDIKIVFNPMESHVRGLKLRMQQCFRNLSLSAIKKFIELAIHDLIYCFQADMVGCVSLADLEVIKVFVSSKKLYLIETGFSQEFYFEKIQTINSLEDNKRKLVFLAYFGSKSNRDALIWFCRYVHPLIRAKVNDYELMIVGRGIDPELRSECNCEGLDWIGEIESVAPIVSKATAGIAPALYGAGVRGKIHQYSALKVPCVASSIGVDSLKYEHGHSIFLADSVEEFASYCVALLSDHKLVVKMGDEAHALCMSEYSWAAMTPNIKSLYFL